MMNEERWQLALGRIREVREEKRLPEPYESYFTKAADFLLKVCSTYERVKAGEMQRLSLEELQKENRELYEEILPENYNACYSNPEYCQQLFGQDYGQALCFLQAELRSVIPLAFEGRQKELVLRLELFLEIYGSFVWEQEEGEQLPSLRALQEMLYYYVSDYTRETFERRLFDMLSPESDFALKILMESDLEDCRYLYAYGEYVTDNELLTWKHLQGLPEETLQKMADTYTEGYRIGFLAGNKDLSKKKTVNIRYCLGFEPMLRRAVENFRSMGLEPTIYRASFSILQGKGLERVGYYGAIPNKQYDFDHKDDQALILDKKLVQIRMEAWREAYEKYREQAAVFGGPAVVEVFGQAQAQLREKASALHLSKEQQKLTVGYMAALGELQNQYIKGEERSFTIIAFPVPEIGEQFPQIFDEVIRINTLDYQLYQRMQQRLIDVLDKGKYVLIKGMGKNRTNMKVMLHTLQDAEKQTNFENCVADVNIPVGEVFTSPQLAGTEGVLHISRVYLSELEYRDLRLTFQDGMVTDYNCANFANREENRKYVRENLMHHHERLPLGEFAIGTNTRAFVAARKFHIESRLPILIAEKTGPHFAVGDTCYSHAEEVAVFNPDGKEIVAKDNECSLRRRKEPEKAYFNCHTDITIPYDELGEVSVVTASEEVIPLILEGRFVLPGTEELNRPLEEDAPAAACGNQFSEIFN